MRIAGSEFNLNYNALEIYLSGCEGHPCKGCHNPELWDASVGDVFDASQMKKYLELASTSLVKRIWILGGEPTDNDTRYLSVFIAILSKTGKEIWLWTRKAVEEIDPMVLKYVDYVKTGMYDSSRPPYTEELFGIELASDNQKIIKIKK